MKSKYTKEEQELIDEYENEDGPDYNKRAALLMNKAGDLSFNAKLRADKSGSIPDNVKDFLEYFTFKTRDIEQLDAIALKLEIALESQENKLTLEEYEKITLSEYNKIIEIGSLYSRYGEEFTVLANSGNAESKKMLLKMEKSAELIDRLNDRAVDVSNYKAGDLMMYLTEKTVAIKGSQKLLGHEGKLEEMFLSRYNHAAPLYINNIDPNRQTVNKSDIVASQQSDNILLGEILQADTLRLDPTKLVNKKQRKLLEKVDYGYRENGSKITWQEVMQERYEQLSNALHEGQVPHKLGRLVIKEIPEQEKKIGELAAELKILQGQEETPERIEEEDRVKGRIRIEVDKFHRLDALREEYESVKLITNDDKRLGAGHWLRHC